MAVMYGGVAGSMAPVRTVPQAVPAPPVKSATPPCRVAPLPLVSVVLRLVPLQLPPSPLSWKPGRMPLELRSGLGQVLHALFRRSVPRMAPVQLRPEARLHLLGRPRELAALLLQSPRVRLETPPVVPPRSSA